METNKRSIGLFAALAVAFLVTFVAVGSHAGIFASAEENASPKGTPALLTATLQDGTIVTVEADEEVLPEGTTVEAKAVDDQVVIDAVTDAVKNKGSAAGSIKAIDVTLRDAAGEEIQPNGSVRVSFSKTGMEGDEVSVYHVTAPEGTEVKDATASDLTVEQVETTKAEADEQVFEASHFSIYAIVDTPSNPRLKVTFLGKDKLTEIASVLVKRSNTLEEVNKIVYDPGAGTLTAGEVFEGWTDDQNYTVDTEPHDVVWVREQAKEKAAALQDDQDIMEFKLYPMVFKSIKVTYLDENGSSLGSETILIPMDQANTSYTVNMAYTPATSTQNFEGWNVKFGGSNIAGYAAGTVYANGTDVTLSGDVTFSVNAPSGHWLIFNENGKGATYNAPQFVKSEQTTVEPTLTMQRVGYTFGGWYTDQACTSGHEFSFGGELTDNTTVYAKWTPVANANYTVLIWKQNIDGTGYDFEESVSLSGTAGSTVSTVTQQGSGNDAYARVNGVDKRYTGFHLKNFDQNVTIAAEGTSVVNVYYDRTEYTLTFQAKRYGNYGNWITVKTITARYQENISSYFPIVGTNGTTYNNGERWDPQSSTPYNQVLVYIDVMPAANVTFHVDRANRPLKTMNYYVEALPGTAGTVSYGGKSFVLYKQVKARYSFVTEAEDYLDLVGFTKFGTDPQFVNGKALNHNYDESINMYYTRDSYKINYMDGVYVDGDGNTQNEANRGQLSTSSDILYDADISSYNSDGGNYYAPTYSEYTFAGWYIDDACAQPYTFNVMPQGGITVYAKWVKNQYRVFLHPNAGTDSTLDWGSDVQQMNFRISSGGKVSLPTGMRSEYEFVGWYTDAACTQAYSSDTVLNDTTVTTPYDKTVDMTDPMDKWGNGATYNKDAQENRFWITKKLDLYAKWRAVLTGAKGIGIIYSATDDDGNVGTNAPSDTLLYLDNSSAVAQAASTAPEGKQFEYWVLQTWDSAQNKYVDTTTHVYPGDSFTVLKANAHDVDNGDGTHTYTVQLRAEYGDKGSKLFTHYTFDANGGRLGDNNETTGHQVEVNGNVQFPAPNPTRAGYAFKGWCNEKLDPTTDLTGKTLLDTSKIYAADDLEGYAWHADASWSDNGASGTGDNILYAVWEPKTVALTVRKELKGGQADLTKKFDFTVSVTAGGKTYTGTAMLGDASLADGDGNTATFTMLTAEDGATHTLQYGDTVVVTEISAAGYSTQYQVLGKAATSGTGGHVTLSDDSVSVDDQGNATSTIVFTNTKDDVVVTGIKAAVASGALPLAVGIGVGVAAVAVAITRFRRDGWGE